jgi:hypothetical protein
MGFFRGSKFFTRMLSLILRTNFFSIISSMLIVHVFFKILCLVLLLTRYSSLEQMFLHDNINLHLFLIPCPSVLFFNVPMISNAVQFKS